MKIEQEQKLFWKKLIPLLIPIAFEQFMFSLVSASDALMLGLVDQSSLSAASLAAQVQFVFQMFLGGLTAGGSILAAQYWGKGSKEDVERVFAVMLRPCALVGALFTGAALLVPEWIMRFFTPDTALIALGADYLRAVSASYLLSAVSQSYLGIMKNSGRAGRASLISSAGVLLNILLNALLIFGLLGMPALGIVGAAAATSITRGIQLLWALADTARPGRIKLRKQYLFAKPDHLNRSYRRHATPVTANNVVWGLGITMGSVILGHLGSDAVAANSIAQVVKNLVACISMGVAFGGGIMLGNELGAGRLDVAKRYGGRLVRLSVLTGAAAGGLLVLLTPVILSLAELTPEAAQYLRWMIVVCAVNVTGMSHNTTIINGIFGAGGDTRFGVVCDTITLWAVVVPLGFLSAFVFRWPVLAVYAIISMDEIIKMPAVWRHYFKYRWVRNLTVNGGQGECEGDIVSTVP